MLDLSGVWDFHADIRLVVEPGAPAFRAKQLDVETCRRMGGLFSATGRIAHASREAQWKRLDTEIALIKGIEGLTLVRAAGDVEGRGRQVLHAEGVYFIQEERDLEDLEKLWTAGYRSLAPLYNEDNALGGGAKGDPRRGLSPLGREVLTRAWNLGFLVDCAHCNHQTIADAIAFALELGRPLHYTHGLLDEPVLEFFAQRGLPRALVGRLVKTGGLIGLSPHPGFQGYFRRFLEEIRFLAGECPAHAVLGSDFTGITTPPITYKDFPSGAETPALAKRLAKEHGDTFAADFCGQTVKRMLQKALPS